MLRIVETDDCVIITERPFAQWIVSGGFALLLLTIVALYFTFSFPQDFLDWLLVVTFAVVGTVSAYAACTISSTEIVLNSTDGNVKMRRTSLFSSSETAFQAAISADPAFVETTSGSRGSRFYQLKLRTTEGNTVELTSAVMKNERVYFEAAEVVNKRFPGQR